MTQGRDAVSILDDAKRTGDFDQLQRLLRAYMRGNAEDKSEIVQEALIEISSKMRKGELTIMLAAQLRGILGTCVKRVRGRKYKAEAKLALTVSEQFQDVLIDDAADPALVFERLRELDQKIAALSEMSRTNPRQFAALQADYQEKDVVEHFATALNTSITPENARKLRERGKKTSDKELKRIQRDAP